MSGNAGLFPCLPLTTFDIKVAGKALNQRDDSIIILEHQIGFLCVHTAKNNSVPFLKNSGSLDAT
jgi:hypothetical protein